jgi:hypothetical protein
MEIAMF